VGEIVVMNSASRIQPRPETERRQFKRFSMRLQVQARRDDLSAPESQDGSATERADRNIDLEVVNFSLGGIRGISPTPLKPDERLTLFMPPFGTRPQIDVTGRVVRCQRFSGAYDVGVEFCQTCSEPEKSPWVKIPELFYMAGETEKEIQ
jgi:hypothetical protein